MAFKNHFFPKIQKKIDEKKFQKKFFFQKNFRIFFQKFLWVEKNILFCKIFESHFSENEIIEN